LGEKLDDPAFVRLLIDLGVEHEWIARVLSNPRWGVHPEGADLLLRAIQRPVQLHTGKQPAYLAYLRLLRKPSWITHRRGNEILGSLRSVHLGDRADSEVVAFERAWKLGRSSLKPLALAAGCLSRMLGVLSK
jgi:hypothetical protein